MLLLVRQLPVKDKLLVRVECFLVDPQYIYCFLFVGQFSWSAGGEVVMGVGGGAPPVPIDTGRGMGDEVEVMSTDSSSSSSTDSN